MWMNGYLPVFVILMMVLSVIGVVQTLMESPQKRAFAGKALVISLVCWALFTVILSFPAIISLPGVARYIGDGFTAATPICPWRRACSWTAA